MSVLLERAGLEYSGGYVDLDGKRIHYLDYGSGPPVLLLHGGGAGSAIWFRQIELLSKTHRVIAPDHPVFGLSSQDAWDAPLPDTFVTYLTAFMDALELGRVDAVGLSMGAQAVLAMALAWPDRFDRLVVIDSAGLGNAFPWIYRLVKTPLVGGLIVRPNRWAQDNYFKTFEVVDSEFADALVYKQYAYDVTLADGHMKAMRKSLDTITGWGGQKYVFSDAELNSITNRLLIIWGEHDKLFPVEHGYRLAGLAPNASLHVVENAAHVPLLDHPDLVNGLLGEFLGNGVGG